MVDNSMTMLINDFKGIRPQRRNNEDDQKHQDFIIKKRE
jgi:hypothetical protein